MLRHLINWQCVMHFAYVGAFYYTNVEVGSLDSFSTNDLGHVC